MIRQGQQLREKKAQLESLRAVVEQREAELQNRLAKRDRALDILDDLRERRFELRSKAAEHINAVLGPRIHVAVTRTGQFEAFASAITDVLRGSGMRYVDLSALLAEQISPRELLEATDTNDIDLIAAVANISKERSGRLLSTLREGDLGFLATVNVEDSVTFQLLDGIEYKDVNDLSTGQRCSVVLPLVLRHTDRLLIVDQPEDHIDNAFIVETLIQSILAREPNGQIVFATHNANIPILGDADLVIHLGSEGVAALRSKWHL